MVCFPKLAFEMTALGGNVARMLRQYDRLEPLRAMPVQSASIQRLPLDAGPEVHIQPGAFMNNIIYIVGLIVVVLAILSFLGLR